MTFTATVSPVLASGVPTGTVDFAVNGGAPTTVSLDTAGTAAFSTAALAAGSNSITAAYSGDSVFVPSTGSATQIVFRTATATVVTSSPNPSFVGASVTFTATVSPAAATGTVDFTVNGATTTAALAAGVATFTTTALPVGPSTLTASYSGDPAFLPSSGTVVQTVNQTDTTTGVVSSLNPSFVGQDVMFTATVTPAVGTVVPTGSILFGVNGGTTSVALDAFGVATLTTNALPEGTFLVTADYSGDAAFLPSGSSLSQVVNRSGTNTFVVSSVNPSTFGQDVTFTATVSPIVPTAIPTGTILFTANGGTTSVALDAAGLATFTTNALPAGSSAITADYSGDGSFLPSTGSVVQSVGKAISTTVVVSSINPSFVGGDVTFTATVGPVLAAGTPSGSVVFTANGTITSVALDATGVAAFTTNALPAGTLTVTAAYGGDASFLPSSGSVTQIVNKTATTTGVVSSLNPSVFGDTVTFTATVSPAAASGTVLFTIDGAAVSQPLVAGTATYAIAVLAAGNHVVSTTYTGDAAYLASTSATLTQVVLRPTTVAVTSNRVPSATLGQNVTFTATVRPVTGTGIPTGTVQFSIDGIPVGAVLTLNAQGRATYSTSTLSAGSHNVFAVYTPATVFAGSTSPTIVQVVNQAATTTTVTSSRNPSVWGQTVTFTARVQPAAAGLASGGQVQFFIDGSAVGGAANLDATGRAVLTASTLAVGNHTVTVQYLATANYIGSTSGPLAQAVAQARSRTVVRTSLSPVTRPNPVTFTATVTAVAPGSGSTTGNVQFFFDGGLVGTVALDGTGVAALPFDTAGLTAGTHTVSAVYSGDGNFLPSTSNNINQRIR